MEIKKLNFKFQILNFKIMSQFLISKFYFYFKI